MRAQADSKALGNHPAFEDPGRPVGVVDLNLGRMAGVSPLGKGNGHIRLRQRNAARHMSGYGGDESVDWLYSGIKYYAETASSAEYHFEKPQEPKIKRTPNDPVAPPNNLFRLLERPNPYMDYIEMMELIVIDLLLVGNSYWMKWKTNDKDQPLALYRLAPPYVEVETQPWGIGAYIYQIPNADKLEIEPDQVVHFKATNPDPANPFYGLGIISGAGRAIDAEIGLTGSLASYYENHALPSLALESERRVPRDVFRKVRAQMRARMQGPKNAGELLVLEAGLKIAPIAPNAVQSAFEGLTPISRDRVLSLLGLSPELLGIKDGSAPSGSLAEAKRNFDNSRMRPFLNRIQNRLTQDLTLAWDLAWVFDYEYQLDPKEQAAMAAAFAPLPGITVDEVRKLAALGPHPDKEVGEITLNLPGEEGEEGDTEKGIPDQGLGGEPGRPPNPGNTRAFPKNGGKLPQGTTARKPKPSLNKSRTEGKAVDVDLTGVLGRLERLIAAYPDNEESPDNPTSDEAKAMSAKADIVKEIREHDVDKVSAEFEGSLKTAARVMERQLLDSIEGKALGDESLVKKIRESPAWGTFEAAARTAYEGAMVKTISAAAVHQAGTGHAPKKPIDYEAVLDKLIDDPQSGVGAITSSFRDGVVEELKSAKADGEEDVTKLLGRVQDRVAEWVSKKVPVIALTEATRSYNHSTLDALEAAGQDHVGVTDGEDSDAACAEADGQVWTIEHAREHLVEHPNCRRGFYPTLKPA